MVTFIVGIIVGAVFNKFWRTGWDKVKATNLYKQIDAKINK